RKSVCFRNTAQAHELSSLRSISLKLRASAAQSLPQGRIKKAELGSPALVFGVVRPAYFGFSTLLRCAGEGGAYFSRVARKLWLSLGAGTRLLSRSSNGTILPATSR